MIYKTLSLPQNISPHYTLKYAKSQMNEVQMLQESRICCHIKKINQSLFYETIVNYFYLFLQYSIYQLHQKIKYFRVLYYNDYLLAIKCIIIILTFLFSVPVALFATHQIINILQLNVNNINMEKFNQLLQHKKLR
ncbi:unnamed protein product [Paramecium sonneborni]|uniref:Transmembrane protein n=1 Tax=Paramecium sonneborni TaxID=65129 RepID=A0A8S1RNT9_9CILI|nr:unnamed protein product [Paramecium sonneborni]